LDDSARATYAAGLALLARRELTEFQLKDRLRRRGHTSDDIDAAVTRLLSERALDDERAAGAIARHELVTRGHGRLRASRRLKDAGVASDLAHQILDRVSAEIDPDGLLLAAIEKRLRRGATITDRKAFERLYRHLVGRGFEPDRVLAALRRRSKLRDGDEDRL
jgi:regulatory protein